ncbi:MAG: hypothetical protein U0166_03065 [Acidobacteriota bacterium]
MTVLPDRFTLGGRCAASERVTGVIVVLLAAGNLALGGLNALVERGPRYAARTDSEGHTDLVLLPGRDVARKDEAIRFVEDVAMRLFAWDDSTRSSDLDYVRDRASASVMRSLDEVVPGYSDAAAGTSGRVDVEIQTTRVVADTLPYRVEIQVAIEFLGSYVPPGAGRRDPGNPRREVFGFLFTLESAGRRPSNPSGLIVTAIAPVAMTPGGA